MKILVVEDDLPTRRYLTAILSRQGHEVLEAPDGREGLTVFERENPPLVLTDILMPRMNGLEMLEKIRARNVDSIVIIQSSMDSPAYTIEALRLRANDYLVKPLEEQNLLATIEKYRQVLASRSLTHEVLGMIYRLDLGMRIGNRLDLVGKVADRLMLEAGTAVAPDLNLAVYLGLVEMLTNAIEHGNLEISYEEKTRAMETRGDGWHQLVAERAEDPKYAARQVTIQFEMSPKSCEWIIEDEGPGFDWEKIPDPTLPENVFQTHGRGIFLTSMTFDVCEFQERGNRVRLVKTLR